MITYIIINSIFAVVWLISYPLRLLPDATLPAALSENLSTLAPAFMPMNAYLPIADVLVILTLTLAVEGGHLTFKLFNWVRRMLPTQS